MTKNNNQTIEDPVGDFLKEINANNYQVIFGFIGRTEETEKLYKLEEELDEKINACAVEQLRLAAKEIPSIKEKTKFDKYEDQTDGYNLFPEHYFSKGITSVISSVLGAWDKKAVAVAILNWILQPQRFSGDKSEEAKALMKVITRLHQSTQ